MAGIYGLEGPGMRAAPGRARGAAAARGGDFTMTEAMAASAPVSPGNVLPAGAPAALGGILALQEAELAATQEREARRHGQHMLIALAALQAALLGAGSAASALSRLQTLLIAVPDVADPGLRQALQAVALRVRLEVARHAAAPP